MNKTRVIWDWSKGPPPCRPGESTIVVNLGKFDHTFYQAVKMPCPLCKVPVVRATSAGQDPNLMQRYYYEANGAAHWPNCIDPRKARMGFKHPPRVTIP